MRLEMYSHSPSYIPIRCKDSRNILSGTKHCWVYPPQYVTGLSFPWRALPNGAQIFCIALCSIVDTAGHNFPKYLQFSYEIIKGHFILEHTFKKKKNFFMLLDQALSPINKTLL